MDPRENLLDHFENPRHKGRLDHPTHEHELRNPICGDQVHIALTVDSTNAISSIAFDGKGCVVSQAAASMLCEAVAWRDADELCALPGTFVLEMIGVPLSVARVKCALLCLETLKRALSCAQPTLEINL